MFSTLRAGASRPGRARARVRAVLGLGVLALTLAVGPPAAYAAAISVNTTADELNVDGDCSLREAIQAANTDAAVDACPAGSGADTITLPAGTYTLAIAGAGEDANATGDLDISAGLTLSGAGQATTILDGADLDRVFHVIGSIAVTMSDLTVQNGSAQIGGGIQNAGGTLSLGSVTVTGNTAPGPLGASRGGGIASFGTLTLADSTVSGNSAGSWGGGIYSGGPTTTLANTTVSGNQTTEDSAENKGGGIYNSAGSTLILTNATVSANTTKLFGGGIWNGGVTTLTNSTIFDNQNTGAFFGGGNNVCCGGGILNLGTLTLTDSTVSSNDVNGSGGGIENQGTATITRSTISGNTAPNSSGAGILNGSSLTIENSTVSGNSAGNLGGGLSNFGTTTITFTTFSDNFAGSFNGGGAIHSTSSATLNLGSSIVANSTAGHDCGGGGFDNAVITSQGYNLIEDASSTCTISGNQTGNIIGSDPALGLLADNGGPTETHALGTNSPAFDAGNPACPPPATDQRGVSRAQGSRCDIGAFELEVPNNPPSCASVAASPNRLWPPNHMLRLITLSGATDPDGDTVTLTITGVTQDEPVSGLGGGDLSPDARTGTQSNNVFVRAERSDRGDGRVYRIAFTGADGRGGTCSGTATVGVPKTVRSTPVDSAPPSYNSFGP